MQTGLIHEFRVAKSCRPKNINLVAFKEKVALGMVGSPELYNCEEVGGMYYWELRREAREAHLVDFLSRYNADFYGRSSPYFDKYCKPAIDYLSTNPMDSELAAWIEETEGLQNMDGWSREVVVSGAQVEVYFSFWSLSYEGKVMVEELEQHLSFFEKAIRAKYADNPLGGSLAVDIG